MVASKLPRRHLAVLFEELDEIRNIIKFKFLCNFLDGPCAVAELVANELHSDGIMEMLGREVEPTFKFPTKMFSARSQAFGEKWKGKVVIPLFK